jgi:hypothetical protein
MFALEEVVMTSSKKKCSIHLAGVSSEMAQVQIVAPVE